jgi:ABC-type Mn2+/Zn2+ transport system permease subunit
VAVVAGLAASYYLDLPPGPAVVMAGVFIFVTRALTLLGKPVGDK